MADQNTDGVIQVYGAVASGPQAGKPNVIDGPTIHTWLIRDQTVINTTASAINTNSGVLDVSTAKMINITMDASITDFDLSGLNGLLNAHGDALDADGMITVINFIQDGAGSRTVAVTATTPKIDFGTSFGSFGLSSSGGRRDMAVLSFEKALDIYKATSFVKGFNQ